MSVCIECIDWCLLEVFDKRCVPFLGSCLGWDQKPRCETEAPFHKRGLCLQPFFFVFIDITITILQKNVNSMHWMTTNSPESVFASAESCSPVYRRASDQIWISIICFLHSNIHLGFWNVSKIGRMVLLFRIKHVKIAFPLSLNLHLCPIGRHTSKLAHSPLRFLKTCTSVFCRNEHARKETQSFSCVLGRGPTLWRRGLLNEEVPGFSTTLPEGSAQTGGSVETRHREECEPLRCHMHVSVTTCHYCDPPQTAGTRWHYITIIIRITFEPQSCGQLCGLQARTFNFKIKELQNNLGSRFYTCAIMFNFYKWNI